MKTNALLYLICFSLLIGCDTERIIFNEPYFVRFTDAAQTEKESYSKPIDIEIHNAGPALDEDIMVSYKISGSAREGIDYKILTERGRSTIPKGKYTGNIQIQLIDNANNILRSQDIVFTLLTVSTGKLQVGQGESFIGTTFTFTILDDCILGGTYTGNNGNTPPVEGLSIVSSDCENYTLSNWNINIFYTTTAMDLKFVDNGDNTITIPEQEEENLPTDLATIKGTGAVDPTTRKIVLTITLVDFDQQPEVSFTLTPN